MLYRITTFLELMILKVYIMAASVKWLIMNMRMINVLFMLADMHADMDSHPS